MNTFISIFKQPIAMLSATILSVSISWFSVQYIPSLMILFWLVAAVALDLATGLLKAWSRKICTVSTGLRKTIVKIGTYCATVVMVTMMINIMGKDSGYDLTILLNGLVSFMVFIELYSVCENISLTYPRSPLTKYMINPILTFLKGRLGNNPISR